MIKTPLWLNGKEVFKDATFSKVSPFTNEVISTISLADENDIDQAISFAKQAQEVWATVPSAEKANVLKETARILRSQNDEIALLECNQTGRCIRETKYVDIISAAECLEYVATLVESQKPNYINLGENIDSYTELAPLGICFGIGAWNYPLQIAAWKAGPAIGAGNAFIFKPSEQTPSSCLYLAKAFKKAGLPDGCFQVLQGYGNVAKKTIERPEVAKVSLTGSVPTGKKVYGLCASDLKRVSLELGGKSPLIIFPDADLEGAVHGAMLANFYSQGEICSNGTRVFVHETIKQDFIDLLKKETEKIVMGDPSDSKTHLGPLINKEQKDKVLGFISRAESDGAKIIKIGEDINGNFVAPRIILDPDDHSEIATEEVFGPVLSLFTFKNTDDVIKRANDTRFGLAAGVFSKDLELAQQVSSQLNAGICWINSYNLTPVQIPFGGVKQSGLGRENGPKVLEEYSQLRTVYVNKSNKYDSFFD